MFNRKSKLRFSLFLAGLFSTSLLCGQTFNVTNRIGAVDNFRTTDATITLTYTVSLTSSAGTLINVIPELTAPSCSGTIFNVTFEGVAGSSDGNLAIPSWANNTSRNLVFKIHLYEVTDFCDNSPCGNDFGFDLNFTWQNRIIPKGSNDTQNLLDLEGHSTGGFNIVHMVSKSIDISCNIYSGSFGLNMQWFPFSNGLITAQTRILLGVNWDLNLDVVSPPLPFTGGIGQFFYPVGVAFNNDRFPLVDRVFNNQLEMIPPSTFIGPGLTGPQFPLAPLGGQGNQAINCNEETWNFFDIGDQLTIGNQRVKDRLAASLGNLMVGSVIQGSGSATNVNFRKAALFLATPGGCNSEIAFGPPPTNFQFTTFKMNGDQAVVGIQVPSAWTSGGQLGSPFTIKWYIRNNQTYLKATRPGGGTTNNKSLTETIALSATTPSEFYIEARITYSSGNTAVISVNSPRHNFAYNGLNNGFFRNAEANPDSFFDVGESFVLPLELNNQTGALAQNFTVELGLETPASALAGFSSETATRSSFGGGGDVVFQGNINSGQSLDLNAVYRLLCIEEICGEINGYIDFAYQNGVFSTSYRERFSLPSNCQFQQESVSINQQDWTTTDCFGQPTPCTSSNCVNTACTNEPEGWQFQNGSWFGDTATFTHFYTLQGPAFDVGENPQIHMRHQATFNFRQAGGILEYRTRNVGGGWTLWSDLITALESAHGGIYHTFNFPSALIPGGVDNLIGDRRVFMDMDAEQNWTLTVPGGTFNQDQVQFRFIFQQPLFLSTSSGIWTLSEFSFLTEGETDDNLFGLPQNLLVPSCSNAVVVTPGVPGAYSYAWYSSLDALVDELAPDHVSNDGTWPSFPPPPGADTDYYAVVTNIGTQTSRVLKFTVEFQSQVPPFFSVVSNWNELFFPFATDIDGDNQVTILDIALQIERDECND